MVKLVGVGWWCQQEVRDHQVDTNLRRPWMAVVDCTSSELAGAEPFIATGIRFSDGTFKLIFPSRRRSPGQANHRHRAASEDPIECGRQYC